MSVYYADGFSLAILKAAGIPDTENIRAVRYEHEVGSVPTITVTRYLAGPDGTELVEQRFVPEQVAPYATGPEVEP